MALAVVCGAVIFSSTQLVSAKPASSVWKVKSGKLITNCDEARFDYICYEFKNGSKKEYCNTEMEITGQKAIKEFSKDSETLAPSEKQKE